MSAAITDALLAKCLSVYIQMQKLYTTKNEEKGII